jgi:hypothetical protein
VDLFPKAVRMESARGGEKSLLLIGSMEKTIQFPFHRTGKGIYSLFTVSYGEPPVPVPIVFIFLMELLLSSRIMRWIMSRFLCKLLGIRVGAIHI